MDASYGRRVAEFLGAILTGNAVYFFLLAPRLPAAWEHQPFAFDRGLVLDFFLCVAAYTGLRWLQRRFDLGRRRY